MGASQSAEIMVGMAIRAKLASIRLTAASIDSTEATRIKET